MAATGMTNLKTSTATSYFYDYYYYYYYGYYYYYCRYYCCRCPGGGGGGALGYLGGCIRSFIKIKKNTPKALISGQKSTLILNKTLIFSTK